MKNICLNEKCSHAEKIRERLPANGKCPYCGDELYILMQYSKWKKKDKISDVKNVIYERSLTPYNKR